MTDTSAGANADASGDDVRADDLSAPDDFSPVIEPFLDPVAYAIFLDFVSSRDVGGLEVEDDDRIRRATDEQDEGGRRSRGAEAEKSVAHDVGQGSEVRHSSGRWSRIADQRLVRPGRGSQPVGDLSPRGRQSPGKSKEVSWHEGDHTSKGARRGEKIGGVVGGLLGYKMGGRASIILGVAGMVVGNEIGHHSGELADAFNDWAKQRSFDARSIREQNFRAGQLHRDNSRRFK